MSPADVEIRYVAGDGIYDLFVNGRFRSFHQTFGEAVKEAEKAIYQKLDIIQEWKALPPRKGKVRA